MQNTITITATANQNFKFLVEVYGEKFYETTVQCPRSSGQIDEIPLVASERLIQPSEPIIGKSLQVTGEVRSYDRHDSDKDRLILSLFADDVLICDSLLPPVNYVELVGHVCKEPTYRLTPGNREITDLMIAVTRKYNKSDYVPCICWGRNARYASEFKVGDVVSLTGRFQSREYIKNNEKHTTLEVSVSTITKC